MKEGEELLNNTRTLLKAQKFEETLEKIELELLKRPKQFDLLCLGNETCRQLKDFIKAHFFAEQIITHFPNHWKGYIRSAQDLIKLDRIEAAHLRFQQGVMVITHKRDLLCLGSNMFRSLSEHKKSLYYARLLREYYPDDHEGYERMAKDLSTLQCIPEARCVIDEGLGKLPQNFELLCAANEIWRDSGDRLRALEYALEITVHYPEHWKGYARAAQDLSYLRRLDEAEAIIVKGLDRCPLHANLLRVASDMWREAGFRDKALKYARLLVFNHPEQWAGYTRVIEDRMAIGSITMDEAKSITNRIEGIPERLEAEFVRSLTSLESENINDTMWFNSFRSCLGDAKEEISADYGWQPFQYWSQANVPDDVDKLTEEWNALFNKVGIPRIIRFNKQTAQEYINKNCPELARPFAEAFHYAVESDIFRVAYALANNCIYIDSDDGPTIYAEKILRQACSRVHATTLCYRAHTPSLCNGFFVTGLGSPFFKRIVSDMKDYSFVDKVKDGAQVMHSFGPARFQLTIEEIAKAPDTRLSSSSELTINRDNIPEWTVRFAIYDHICKGSPLKYKNTNNSWHNVFGI